MDRRSRSGLEGLPLLRTAAAGGALAGVIGGSIAALLAAARALVLGMRAEEGLEARAALIGAEPPWAGALLLLCLGALIGALVGWRAGLRSGLDHFLRGVGIGLLLWVAGRLALPIAAPAPWADPLAPRLPEYLAFGAALGLQARLCRVLLRRQWRRRIRAMRGGAAAVRASSSGRRQAHSR